MMKFVVLAIGSVLALATVEAQQKADRDHEGVAAPVAGIGEQVEAVFDANPSPLAQLEPRNVNISSTGWNSIRDSVLLRVQGRNANAASSQQFGVIACDRDSLGDHAHISLMRVANPREVVTSTNDSLRLGGNLARTVERFVAEGRSETLYAVLTVPHLENSTTAAGWQIASAGYRTLSVTLLDTFNADGSAPAISFAIGCGASPF